MKTITLIEVNKAEYTNLTLIGQLADELIKSGVKRSWDLVGGDIYTMDYKGIKFCVYKNAGLAKGYVDVLSILLDIVDQSTLDKLLETARTSFDYHAEQRAFKERMDTATRINKYLINL